MRKLVWIGLILEVSPALAFLLLVVLHPVGDPQDSGNMFVRILDYQGAFWIRKAIPVPPPLLFAGVCLLFPIWLKNVPLRRVTELLQA